MLELNSSNETLLENQIYTLTCELHALSRERRTVTSHLTHLTTLFSEAQTRLLKLETQLKDLRGEIQRPKVTRSQSEIDLPIKNPVSRSKLLTLFTNLDPDTRQILIHQLTTTNSRH